MFKKISKEEHNAKLKKSFIISGIMLGIIVLIFVFASNVNNKVAENMKGRMLYINSNNGMGRAYLYDFDNKTDAELTDINKIADGLDGDVCELRFISAVNVAAVIVADDVADIYVEDIENGIAKLIHTEKDVKKVISFECNSDGSLLLAACEDSAGMVNVFTVNVSDGLVTDYVADGLVEDYITENMKITGACFTENEKGIYIAAADSKTTVYSVNIDLGILRTDENENTTIKLKALYDIDGNNAYITTAFNGNILIQREDDNTYISAFNLKRERESRLEFCKDEHNFYEVCTVSENMYIVGSDMTGNGDIYVCNGSNTDAVEAVNNDSMNIPMDYLKTE